MTRLYMATSDGLLVVTRRGGVWGGQLRLRGKPAQCVAVDPLRPEVVYCGSFGEGLLRSGDGGDTWEPVGDGIVHREIMAVAVSRAEPGVVWAGTEPSALFRSEDGGRTWQERPALRQIPSAPTWSFPPRPWTHHVRWIEPDPVVAGRLFVAIELGGVMRSEDTGLTWEDRKPGAKFDAHTLRAHPLAPGRLCEAAGDGYAETADGGGTWQPGDGGLAWHYLWGMALDPADPRTQVVSASPGPRHAHDPHWRAASVPAWHRDLTGAQGTAPAVPRGVPGFAGPPPWAGYDWRGPEAWLYRRVADGPWQAVTEGLPAARGTLAYVLASHEAEPHVFYASPWSDAVYRSADGGRRWEGIPVAWPAGHAGRRVNALVAAPAM